jgi:hypothetical protein
MKTPFLRAALFATCLSTATGYGQARADEFFCNLDRAAPDSRTVRRDANGEPTSCRKPTAAELESITLKQRAAEDERLAEYRAGEPERRAKAAALAKRLLDAGSMPNEQMIEMLAGRPK